MAKKHVLLPRAKMLHGRPTGAGAAAPRRPAGAYDYPMTAVGSTAHVTVMVDPGIAGGTALARKCLAVCEADYLKVAALFGVPAGQVNFLVAPLGGGDDGSGGAYHYGCDGSDLYCDDDTSDDGSRTEALFCAELVEVFEAALANGWDCGASNGEGLSRTLAESLHPGVLNDYATFAAWLDGGRPDWVSQTEPTDQNALSTSCAAGFLWWLVSLGYSWPQVVRAGGSTLAQTYQALTGKTTAWEDFGAACQARWPAGQPSGVATDDPWAAAPPPAPPPPPPGVATIVLPANLAAGTYVLVPSSVFQKLTANGVTLEQIAAQIEATLGALGQPPAAAR
jgi:hypothetical protein